MTSMREHNDVDSNGPDPFTIEVKEEEGCAFVTIHDTAEYPSLEQILNCLRDRNLPYWIDEGTIAKELAKKTTGQPFRAAFAKDPKFEIKVDTAQRFATLVLKEGFDGRETTMVDVQLKLNEMGIVSGVDLDRVVLALSEKTCDKPVVIARATEPVHGTDAAVDCLFPLQLTMHPKELENNRVDFRELKLIYAAAQGDVLARKIPATRGKPGMTVTGKEIPAKPGRDIALTAGRNTTISPDGMEVTAAIAGQPFLKGRSVFVEPVYSIKGDINYSVGNVDFKGSVKIDGSVVSGFSIKATESIEINGVVEDCFLEAGMDISIKGGVLGADKGIIKAGRDFSALFVENCHVEAGRNIVVGDALNSELSAGDSIDVVLGTGRVIGSKLSAQNLAAINTLGSPIAGRTQVAVGFEPKTVALLKEVKESARKTEYTLEEIGKHISTLEELSRTGSLTEEKENLYGRLLATADELDHQLQEHRGRIEMIESTMAKAAQPTVKVRGTCYPNVRIKIGTLMFDCTTEYQSAVFYEEDGRIKVNVYDNKT
ncbi:MAG: hypothetical protein A4E61_01456 [Syntrophorhabdus sp. PtaB.Bin184]|nr:MAG: hypothetical protein A4E61_01456 [Syntrophorhabdus sp. PtaB.Bin184]